MRSSSQLWDAVGRGLSHLLSLVVSIWHWQWAQSVHTQWNGHLVSTWAAFISAINGTEQFGATCTLIQIHFLWLFWAHGSLGNFDQTCPGFCFQVLDTNTADSCFLQHEKPSARPLSWLLHYYFPGQARTLGHGFFMVWGCVWEQINLSWQRNQLAFSLWSPHTSSYQFYFIFSHFLHLCFPSHKPHGQQKLSNVSHQHSTAGSGGSQHITQFQPTPQRQARISRPSRELNTQLPPRWQALCFQTSWDPLQGAHILQLLITKLLAIHRTARFHVFYIVYHTGSACEQTSGPSPTQITLLPCTNQIFMLAFEVFRLHSAEPAARNLLTSQTGRGLTEIQRIYFKG